MNLLDVLRSLGGAFAHRLRAALTLLGIVIGTGSIVLLASLIGAGKAFLKDANQEVSNVDIVEVYGKDPPPEQKNRTTRPLTAKDAAELSESAALAGDLVSAERSHDVFAHYRDREKRVAVVSSVPQTLSLYRLHVESGRAIDADDRTNGRRVCVVGHEVYDELLRNVPVAGADKQVTVDLEGHLFTVVGVLAKKPSMGNSDSTYVWDRKVLIPETTYDLLYSPSHEVKRIYVRAPEKGEGGATESRLGLRGAVAGILQRRHLGVLNFELQKDQSGGTEKLIFDVIEILLLGTGVLALLASGINIMNVMLVTVSERTREIGLRRAIGATRQSILVQFLLEAATLSFAGGVIGVGAGAALAWLIAVGARSSFGRWDFVVPAWSVILGLALAFVTGLAFGSLPAWRASRVSPIEALRAD
jgi:putative ABC transport system permease protein